MAFTQEANRVPTSIGDINLALNDWESVANTARYVLEVKDQNGDVMKVIDGDLTPHLTAGEVTTIQDFLATIRARAESQILP